MVTIPDSPLIRIGEHGIGFVIEAYNDPVRMIVTNASCLPEIPTPQQNEIDFTFPKLHGDFEGKTTVDGDCIYAEAITDIAVLKPTMYDDNALMDERRAFKISSALNDNFVVNGTFLTADNNWANVVANLIQLKPYLNVNVARGPNGEHAAPPIAGSPIITENYEAIAVMTRAGACNLNKTLPSDMTYFLKPDKPD